MHVPESALQTPVSRKSLWVLFLLSTIILFFTSLFGVHYLLSANVLSNPLSVSLNSYQHCITTLITQLLKAEHLQHFYTVYLTRDMEP